MSDDRDRLAGRARTYPQFFKGFNARMFEPGGFYRGNTARER